MNKFTVAQSQHAARAGRDPQATVLSLAQSQDVRVFHLRKDGPPEESKPRAVESGEAVLGAHPQKAVARLHHRLHRVLRQAIIGLPGARMIGREIACPRGDWLGNEEEAAGEEKKPTFAQ